VRFLSTSLTRGIAVHRLCAWSRLPYRQGTAAGTAWAAAWSQWWRVRSRRQRRGLTATAERKLRECTNVTDGGIERQTDGQTTRDGIEIESSIASSWKYLPRQKNWLRWKASHNFGCQSWTTEHTGRITIPHAAVTFSIISTRRTTTPTTQTSQVWPIFYLQSKITKTKDFAFYFNFLLLILLYGIVDSRQGIVFSRLCFYVCN